MAELGAEAHGLDITHSTSWQGIRGNFKLGNFYSGNLPYAPGHFDLITIFHFYTVLEIQDILDGKREPLEWREMARILKPGGIIAIPNYMEFETYETGEIPLLLQLLDNEKDLGFSCMKHSRN